MKVKQVVNVRKKNLQQTGYTDFENWAKDPNHVYIGRDMNFYVKGATKSKWANIFSVEKYGRDKCLELYKNHILSTPNLLNSLHELDGKVLGCWCAPERCHGDVLAELVSTLKNK